MRFLRSIGKYVALLLAVSLCVLALEYLAGLVPQQRVRENLLASMDQLKSEGLAPGVLYDGHPRSKLDNLSENYILTYSYYMDTRSDPASILTNPGRQIQDPYGELFLQTEELLEQELDPDTNYVRYWLGFRLYVRPLMAVMNYMDARQCIQWGFFLLLGAVTILLYRQTKSPLLALAFPAAISQLNPLVAASCFQYSVCLYIAMLGMLCTPLVRGRRFTLPMLFTVIGLLTQVFDFYTAPVLTFGLPMIALLLNRDIVQRPSAARWKLLLACLGGWLLGYIGGWLVKMLLTTLFTPYNGLSDGLTRLAYWFRPEGESDPLLPLKAVFYCFINIVDLVPLVVEAVLLLTYCVCLLRRRPGRGAIAGSLIYLAVAALPVLWFLVAARPSYEQFYFQYRSLGVFLLGGLVFLIKSAGWDRLLSE